MSKSKDQLAVDAEKLRNRLADAQSVVDDLIRKLRRIEGKLTGEPAKATGLDMLWNAAPPMARTRSSKFLCLKAWNRIPESERPKFSDLMNSLRAWSRCWDWKKDGGMYVPGLDKWISERRFENLPEDTAGSATRKFETTPKPASKRPPEPDPDAPLDMDSLPASAADIAAAFAPLKSIFQSQRPL